MIIAVDATGGDYAPQEIVKGAVEAASELDIEIVLLGDKPKLDSLLKQVSKKGKITTVQTTQDITCDEHPVQAVRNKPDSSIVRGIQMVRKGTAAAFVSAGNTGAVLAASVFLLDRLPGIERPAIAVVVPVGPGGPFLFLDAGANADCRARYLVQFARVGSVFARLDMGIASPRVGLLNNGGEEAKGNALTVEAHQLLKKSGLNFIGNVEGQDILKGKADVLVTDGFTGNIVLKTMEGFGDMLHSVLMLESLPAPEKRHTGTDGQGDGKISSLVKLMDFSEYGGSCLLGLKGNVIICHGRSKARAIKNAIRSARQAAASGMIETLMKELKPDSGNTQKGPDVND
ncbi:MAG: phosphate acyltransferase PlsX [Dehalococcoidia bacterium]|jgi:glycerol-3-phosphate acyltransferase PlsX